MRGELTKKRNLPAFSEIHQAENPFFSKCFYSS